LSHLCNENWKIEDRQKNESMSLRKIGIELKLPGKRAEIVDLLHAMKK
jgi:hypothetical protein